MSLTLALTGLIGVSPIPSESALNPFRVIVCYNLGKDYRPQRYDFSARRARD